MIKPPNPQIKFCKVAFESNQRLTKIAMIGINGPNGILNGRSTSFFVFRKIKIDKQVGKYWANRETTLIAANVVNEPERAIGNVINPVIIIAQTGALFWARFFMNCGNKPSSAKATAERGVINDEAMLIPPIEINSPAATMINPPFPINSVIAA